MPAAHVLPRTHTPQDRRSHPGRSDEQRSTSELLWQPVRHRIKARVSDDGRSPISRTLHPSCLNPPVDRDRNISVVAAFRAWATAA